MKIFIVEIKIVIGIIKIVIGIIKIAIYCCQCNKFFILLRSQVASKVYNLLKSFG